MLKEFARFIGALGATSMVAATLAFVSPAPAKAGDFTEARDFIAGVSYGYAVCGMKMSDDVSGRMLAVVRVQYDLSNSEIVGILAYLYDNPSDAFIRGASVYYANKWDCNSIRSLEQ